MTTVTVPAESLYGLDNLPYGVYSVDGSEPRVATRLGDTVVDLAGLLGDEVFARPSLNAFMAQGHEKWVQVRAEIRDRLGSESECRGCPTRCSSRSRRSPCTCRWRSPTTSTSTPPSTTPRTWAGSSGPDPRPPHAELETPADRLPRPCGHDRGVGHGHRAAVRSAQGPRRRGARVRAEHPARHRGGAGLHRRNGVRARGSPSRWRRQSGTSSVWCSSTTGRPATSRRGSTSRSGRTSASRSPPRSRPGWCRSWRCRRRRCPRRAGPAAAALPRGAERAVGAGRRPRGLLERRGRHPAAVPRDVLVASTDAGAPDRERRLDPHRRPVRLGHHLRAGEGHTRRLHRAHLGRVGTGPGGRRGSAPSSRTGTRWC